MKCVRKWGEGTPINSIWVWHLESPQAPPVPSGRGSAQLRGHYLFRTFVLVCSFFCVFTLSLLQKDTSPPPSTRTVLLQARDSLGTPQGHQKRGGAQREGSTAVVSPPGAQSRGQPQGTWVKQLPGGSEEEAEQAGTLPAPVSCLTVKGMRHCLSAPPGTVHGIGQTHPRVCLLSPSFMHCL